MGHQDPGPDVVDRDRAAHAPGGPEAEQTLIIDDEFKALIPPLTPEEHEGLERSLLDEGCRDALKVWDSGEGLILLDGHNRYEICTAHGIHYPLEHVECADREAAHEWVLRWQLERRNLPPLARVELALRLKPLLIERAKANQKAGGARSDGEGGVVRQNSDNPLDTKREIARIAGVSHDTVHKAEHVLDHGPEDLVAQVRAGEVSIHSAYQTVKKDERSAAQESRREENRTKANRVAQRPKDTTAKKHRTVKGVFDVIVIDPLAEYPRMDVGELADLELPAAGDCHVWVWTTNEFLPETLRLLDEWKLTYVRTFVWHKVIGGTRSAGLPADNCEFAVYARRGSPEFIETNRFPVCFTESTGEKPGSFYRTIKRVTRGRRLTMFSHKKYTGFDWMESRTREDAS